MKWLILSLAAWALVPVLLRAEERGQVSGSVTDASGGVLDGASVTVMNQDTGIRRSVRSGGTGDYAVGALPAGSYKVTARKSGFQTIAHLDVRVRAGESANVDFAMQV